MIKIIGMGMKKWECVCHKLLLMSLFLLFAHFLYYTQAVVLCQFPPNGVDYAAVFQLIRDHSSEVLETVFDFLWDMTIIEYLICILRIYMYLYTFIKHP